MLTVLATHRLTSRLASRFVLGHAHSSIFLRFLYQPFLTSTAALRENGELHRLAKLSVLSCDILASISSTGGSRSRDEEITTS